MNKDLDERLVPKGEYRDAMNIQVHTSEGADVGTVTNVLGNTPGCTYDINNPNPIIPGMIKNPKAFNIVPVLSLWHPSITSLDMFSGNSCLLFSKNNFRFFHAFTSAATPTIRTINPDNIRITDKESEI